MNKRMTIRFRSIYSTYYPKIVRYLNRIVGEPEAQDVAQEVFVKVHAALDTFRGESSISTWIYRIATNAAMDHLRSRGARGRKEIGDTDDSMEDRVESAKDEHPGPDAALIKKDMNECIQEIINKLPEKYKTILVLSDIEGLTNAEIAEVLGITLDTVKIRLHRSRARLKKELESSCHFYRDDRNEFSCDRKTHLPHNSAKNRCILFRRPFVYRIERRWSICFPAQYSTDSVDIPDHHAHHDGFLFLHDAKP